MRAIKNVTSSWNWPNLSASNCCTCPPTRPTSISSNACGNSSRRIVCTRPITTTLRSSNRPSHPVSLKLKPHTGPPSTPCFPTASRPLKNQKLCQVEYTVKEVGDGRAHVELPGGRSADVHVHSAGVAAGVLELGVRPEHLTLAASEDPTAAFAGVVAIVERLGNSTILYIDTPAGQLIVEGEGNLSIKSGENVGLTLAAPQAHLFDANGAVV